MNRTKRSSHIKNTRTESIRRAVRVALARKGMTQLDLAHLLGVPPTSLSDWLRGAHPAPPNLVRRLEKALGVGLVEIGGAK